MNIFSPQVYDRGFQSVDNERRDFYSRYYRTEAEEKKFRQGRAGENPTRAVHGEVESRHVDVPSKDRERKKGLLRDAAMEMEEEDERERIRVLEQNICEENFIDEDVMRRINDESQEAKRPRASSAMKSKVAGRGSIRRNDGKMIAGENDHFLKETGAPGGVRTIEIEGERVEDPLGAFFGLEDFARDQRVKEVTKQKFSRFSDVEDGEGVPVDQAGSGNCSDDEDVKIPMETDGLSLKIAKRPGDVIRHEFNRRKLICQFLRSTKGAILRPSKTPGRGGANDLNPTTSNDTVRDDAAGSSDRRGRPDSAKADQSSKKWGRRWPNPFSISEGGLRKRNPVRVRGFRGRSPRGRAGRQGGERPSVAEAGRNRAYHDHNMTWVGTDSSEEIEIENAAGGRPPREDWATMEEGSHGMVEGGLEGGSQAELAGVSPEKIGTPLVPDRSVRGGKNRKTDTRSRSVRGGSGTSGDRGGEGASGTSGRGAGGPPRRSSRPSSTTRPRRTSFYSEKSAPAESWGSTTPNEIPIEEAYKQQLARLRAELEGADRRYDEDARKKLVELFRLRNAQKVAAVVKERQRARRRGPTTGLVDLDFRPSEDVRFSPSDNDDMPELEGGASLSSIGILWITGK